MSINRQVTAAAASASSSSLVIKREPTSSISSSSSSLSSGLRDSGVGDSSLSCSPSSSSSSSPLFARVANGIGAGVHYPTKHQQPSAHPINVTPSSHTNNTIDGNHNIVASTSAMTTVGAPNGAHAGPPSKRLRFDEPYNSWVVPPSPGNLSISSLSPPPLMNGHGMGVSHNGLSPSSSYDSFSPRGKLSTLSFARDYRCFARLLVCDVYVYKTFSLCCWHCLHI